MNAFDPEVNRAFSCFPCIDSQGPKLRAKSMEDLTLRMTRTSAETGAHRHREAAGLAPPRRLPSSPTHTSSSSRIVGRGDRGNSCSHRAAEPRVLGSPSPAVAKVRYKAGVGEAGRTGISFPKGTSASWAADVWILPSAFLAGTGEGLKEEAAGQLPANLRG